jgi:hypothetical protein
MSESIQHNPSAPAAASGSGAEIVLGAIRGVWRFAALHAMATLGCADELRAGPLTAAELAERCGAHAPSLARVLRAVATMGLVETVGPETYALTEAGTALCDPGSLLRLAIPFCAEEACWYALGALPETVRTGRSAFAERHGSLYEYLAGKPESSRLFDDFMVARSRPLAAGVARHHDFSDVKTVVDVGGGNGTFLAAILRAHPHLHGILLDLDHVLPGARELLEAEGVGGRCQLVAGDYFKELPRGADVYVLASVIHNWDDEDALRLLRVVRDAVPDDGRVLVVDAVLPDDDRSHYGKDLDIRILSLFGGGKERTKAEFSGLLTDAGLAVGRVTELGMGLSLVEAVPQLP